MRAEFCLVFFDVVETFHPVVSEIARIFLFTLLRVTELTQIWRVGTPLAPLVDMRVEVRTVLVVVLALDVAFVDLEDLEIEVLDDSWLTSSLGNCLEFDEQLFIYAAGLCPVLLRTLRRRLLRGNHRVEGIRLVVRHGVCSRPVVRSSALFILLGTYFVGLRRKVHLLEFVDKLLHWRY